MRMISISPGASRPSRLTFLLAGESDMSGRGLLSELPAFPNAARVKLFTNAWVWAPAYEPTDDPSGQVDSVSVDTIAAASPGMSFGTSIAALRPGVEIGLVPCAKGGSRIADWSRNLSRSSLYGSMIARAQAAASTGQIAGLLWMQGKNDADTTLASAEAWQASCYQFIENVRADLGVPALPVVVTVVNASSGTNIGVIQAAQAAMTGTAIAVVSATDLPDIGDSAAHLSTAGLVTLGERYAAAMHGLL